jgi:group I intron endonuclease
MRRASLYIIGFPNGKLYVGITTGTVEGRFRRHCQSAKVVGRAIRKHGSESCRLIVLHRGLSWKEAGNLERWYIRELETGIKQNGYNVAGGGGGTLGVPLSSRGRRAVSRANHRRWLENPEEMQAVVAKAHAAVRGRKHTGDRLKKSHAAQQAATAAATKANRGRKHTGDRLKKSQAAVAKARKVRSTQVVSKETRKKMSEAQKQAWERRRAHCAVAAISA